MHTPKVVIALVAAAATLATPAVFAGSHGGDLPPAVQARQAHMSLYGHNIGQLVPMMRGDVEYDAEAATAAASNIAALSALDQRTYWVPGTDSDSIEGTRALPALWDNIPDAIEKGQAVNAAATNLAATAGDGLDALKAGLGPLFQACNACHDEYQKSNN